MKYTKSDKRGETKGGKGGWDGKGRDYKKTPNDSPRLREANEVFTGREIQPGEGDYTPLMKPMTGRKEWRGGGGGKKVEEVGAREMKNGWWEKGVNDDEMKEKRVGGGEETYYYKDEGEGIREGR